MNYYGRIFNNRYGGVRRVGEKRFVRSCGELLRLRVLGPDGWIDLPVTERARLKAGTVIGRAAIVEQFDSTLLILPGQRAEVGVLGNIVIWTCASEAQRP